MDAGPERSLSHYRLLEQIGKGGMGVVWKAHDTVLDRIVAIKVLPASTFEFEGSDDRLLVEARRASSLNDPHIAQIHDFGRVGAVDFIVMEYVDGDPLNRQIRGHAMPPTRIARLGLQIAGALAHAHRKQLIHRDLKPGNVILTGKDDVKIVDFGLAALYERQQSSLASDEPTQSLESDSVRPSEPRSIAGTLPYMSPEQVRGRELDSRTDIFSLGVMLYELSTGVRPFVGATSQELLERIDRAEHRPPQDLEPGLPLELVRIIEKALARRRGDRYQTMDDLAVDLKRLSRELDDGSSLSYADVARGATSPAAEDGTGQLMVLLQTDIAGSVALQQEVGTAAYKGLIARHDELFAGVVQVAKGGEILRNTGNGFVARFLSASDAVAAALRFQYVVHGEAWSPEPLQVRMGLHLGEVSEVRTDTSGQPRIVGRAVDIVDRLVELGLPGQILTTRAVFDEARQVLRDHPSGEGVDQGPRLRWMAHGNYLIQGSDDPVRVFEVGGDGIAPLEPPRDSETTRRSVSAEEEPTLGWRPATGLEIPRRSGWTLERRLGEGGFGEVWFGVHGKTGERRVFKFCFDPERLRSFKRELTLFRLLRESLGERADIAKLYEVQLEQSPFYLESEYSESGDLAGWAEEQGGIAKIPMQTRLDQVIRIAEAAAAAHSVGVLHKDIKPSEHPRCTTTQDGSRPAASGGLRHRRRHRPSRTRRAARSRLSGSRTWLSRATTRLTSGTQMYAPPELLAGRPFTIAGRRVRAGRPALPDGCRGSAASPRCWLGTRCARRAVAGGHLTDGGGGSGAAAEERQRVRPAAERAGEPAHCGAETPPHAHPDAGGTGRQRDAGRYSCGPRRLHDPRGPRARDCAAGEGDGGEDSGVPGRPVQGERSQRGARQLDHCTGNPRQGRGKGRNGVGRRSVGPGPDDAHDRERVQGSGIVR